jgi:formylglycine-generating enzyme required for sulfatase activity
MRSLFALLLLIHFCCPLFGEINVKLFRKLENDMDARITSTLKDQNGDLCAIIKVVTTETGFNFDCGIAGIMKTQQNKAEIWVYIPWGAKRISISHEKLGILRDYMFPMPIEKATVYELVLNTGPGTALSEQTIDSQWLYIKTEPSSSLIYLNDKFVKSGEYSAKLSTGNYTYRVEAPLYQNEVGIIEIKDSKKEINVILKPAFGYINFKTSPESGAKVFIDGKVLDETTPCKSGPLPFGEHTVHIIKEMYQPVIRKFNIVSGRTDTIHSVLTPNYAELTVTSLPEASIYVNQQQKGKGSWKGRLDPGIYTLEAKISKFNNAKKDIQLNVGDLKTVDLQPVPMLGSLDITSNPQEAIITLDDKDYGKTPNSINHLLVGEHKLKLTKSGYITVNKMVNVTEGVSNLVEEIFVKENAAIEKSIPSKALSVSDGVNSDKASYTETVKGVNLDMVAIKGGTFKMGSQDGDKYEKPVHDVTVSSFAMGRTEVTVAQFEKFINSTAYVTSAEKEGGSYFWNVKDFGSNRLINWRYNCQGELMKRSEYNHPVIHVTLEDAMAYCSWLSKETGKNYRLPTEAEWEYAAGNGVKHTRFSWGNGYTPYENNIENIYDSRAYKTLKRFTCFKEYKDRDIFTSEVASYIPNELGLFDMNGNVTEMCNDKYDFYKSQPQINPHFPLSGYDSYATRGGSWDSGPLQSTVFHRSSTFKSFRHCTIGFRVVCSWNESRIQ